MTDGSPVAGSMSRRVLGLLRRLPVPIQAYAYWAIENFALFLVIMLVIPVVVVVFIVATVILGALYWVLGSPTGPIGVILAFGWLASWTVLPVIITVRMWRSVPVIRQVVRFATDGLEVEQDPAVAVLDTPDGPTFHERIVTADASLAPKTADPMTGDGPRDDGRPTG